MMNRGLRMLFGVACGAAMLCCACAKLGLACLLAAARLNGPRGKEAAIPESEARGMSHSRSVDILAQDLGLLRREGRSRRVV